jgi:hypothetical protein
MRWRDIRFEKPTEKDADADGNVGQLLNSGEYIKELYKELTNCVAWMPTSELPQPDLPGPIPDGWRPVDKEVDDRTQMTTIKAWRHKSKCWVDVCGDNYSGWSSDYYIVPIEQPKPAPQYRPFASAAEFMPHADRWITRSFLICPDHAGAFRCSAFDDYGIWERDKRTSYSELMSEGRKFADDGTPFGIKIETNQ